MLGLAHGRRLQQHQKDGQFIHSPAAREVSGMAASEHCSIAITRRSSSRYRGKKKGPFRLASSSASSTTRGLRLRIHCGMGDDRV